MQPVHVFAMAMAMHIMMRAAAVLGAPVTPAAVTDACASGFQIRGSCVPVGVSPLHWYVHSVHDSDLPEPFVTQQFKSSNGCEVSVVNFTSQRWLTDDEFKATSAAKSVWTHQLIVTSPPGYSNMDANASDTGWLWVTGGHNNPLAPLSPIAEDDAETAVSCALSLAANTVGAVLHQVPNQPVQFARDIPHSSMNYPNESRTEDGIISYTWNHFCFNDSTAPEWLLRLPMTKSVSRAMDVVSARHKRIRKFVVGGASKRGWTTWTTGLVEPRCAAIVPVVMDLLNLIQGTDNHYKSLGGYTFEFADYIEAGVVGSTLFTPNYSKLTSIVDAYSYFKVDAPWRSKFFESVPKLVINAGNDEFFLPDDDHIWWDELPGEKHRLHIPNADHPFRYLPPFPPGYVDGTEVFVSGLLPFFSAVSGGQRRPSFSWDISKDGTEITAYGFSVPPSNISMYQATTKDGFRDFRLYNCRTGSGTNCTNYEADPGTGKPGYPAAHAIPYRSVLLKPSAALSNDRLRPGPPAPRPYIGKIDQPAKGQWTTFFLEARWAAEDGGFRFTTQQSVVPVGRPFRSCKPGAETLNCGRMV